jgi:hypothetical protein
MERTHSSCLEVLEGLKRNVDFLLSMKETLVTLHLRDGFRTDETEDVINSMVGLASLEELCDPGFTDKAQQLLDRIGIERVRICRKSRTWSGD